MTLHAAAIPEHRAAQDPHGRCLSSAIEQMTNSDFAVSVRSAARCLGELGIGTGDVVAVIAPNSIDLVVLMFATWRCRATLTPVNPVLTSDEVAHQLTDSGAALVVTAQDVLGAPDEGPPWVGFDDLLSASTRVIEEPTYALDDLALLIYTSGTTARPKGVMLTHDNVAAMAEAWIDWLEVSERDRCLLVLPLFHVNGIMVSAVGPLWAGASVAIEPGFVADTFWSVVERERPTYFSAVPPILSALATLPADVVPDATSLRFVGCGAAPASANLLDAFETRYGVSVVEGYGLTECTLAATINPLDGPRKPGTVGCSLPGIEVAILQEDGRVGPDGTGEILVRGRTVMRGYLGQPEASRLALRGGWLHTGDIGHLDDDGYLAISDRIKDLVIWGGENISSSEVERVLVAYPDVRLASVVGRPHERYGEEPVAFVVPMPGATVETDRLLEFSAQRLARFKIPREVWVVPTLPTNAVGKVLKGPLRDLARSEQ